MHDSEKAFKPCFHLPEIRDNHNPYRQRASKDELDDEHGPGGPGLRATPLPTLPQSGSFLAQLQKAGGLPNCLASSLQAFSCQSTSHGSRPPWHAPFSLGSTVQARAPSHPGYFHLCSPHTFSSPWAQSDETEGSWAA